MLKKETAEEETAEEIGEEETAEEETAEEIGEEETAEEATAEKAADAKAFAEEIWDAKASFASTLKKLLKGVTC